MRVLRHRTYPIFERVYAAASFAVILGIGIGAVCIPPALFEDRGSAPVFAREEQAPEARGAVEPEPENDYADVYAEDAGALHGAFLARLDSPPGGPVRAGALDAVVNAVGYRGAAWGLRQGRVDLIDLVEDPGNAVLGQPNPHRVSGDPRFKRPLDAFEQEHLPGLSAAQPVAVEVVEGGLRMVGLIPNGADCAVCHGAGPEEQAFLGVFSYHFTEIADD